LLLEAARFAANKIAVRAKFDLLVLVVVAGGDTDELLTPVDSLLTSLSDKLFLLRVEFKEGSVDGSVECSESERERDCFREERSSIAVESFVISGGSVDAK
jgi:hypothetical protein